MFQLHKTPLDTEKLKITVELAKDMLSEFKDVAVKMNIMIYYLFSHLDCFLANLVHLSQENGKGFHQDLKAIDDRYQGNWVADMMADYC